LARKKLKIKDLKTSTRQTFTSELQSEQVQSYPQKFAPTLVLKWHPQDLIGRAKLFDISAANQNQGGERIFSPNISRLARKMTRFTEVSLSLAARIDNNVSVNLSKEQEDKGEWMH